MSSDPQLPGDDEIEAYLRGDDALSKAYRAATREQPSREVDESVLAFAQQAVRPHRSLRRRWQAPMALAAVLVLGLGLVINLWREPEVRAPVVAEPAAVQVPELAAESAIVAESAAAQAAAAQAKLAQEQARERSEQRAYQEQTRRAAERAESELAREAAKRHAMQDAAPAAAEAPPPPPPPPAAPPAMALAPRAAFARESASRAAPLAKAEREALPAQALSAAPNMQGKNAFVPSGWTPARFGDFELGTATRADVVARYGEPESQGVSESDDAPADVPRLHYDAYPSLPGVDGLAEFYYEPVSLRLLGVRVILRTPMPAQTLVDRLGWSEPAQARDWAHPPCGSVLETRPAAAPETQAPHYGVYPQRGAYLFQPAGLVEQIVYEADCSWP